MRLFGYLPRITKSTLEGGTDKVIFYNSNSTDYSFSKKGETINVESRITGSITEITNTEFIEFRPEQRIIDTKYFDSTFKASLLNIVHSLPIQQNMMDSAITMVIPLLA